MAGVCLLAVIAALLCGLAARVTEKKTGKRQVQIQYSWDGGVGFEIPDCWSAALNSEPNHRESQTVFLHFLNFSSQHLNKDVIFF